MNNSYIKFDAPVIASHMVTASRNLANLAQRYDIASARADTMRRAKHADDNSKRWFKRAYRAPVGPHGAYFLKVECYGLIRYWTDAAESLVNQTESVYLTMDTWQKIKQWIDPRAAENFLKRHPDVIMD